LSVDVLGYLESKGLGASKSAGPNNVHVACPFCNEDPGKRGRLYVNIDPEADIPSLFFCHRCGSKGNLTTLRKFFNDPIPKQQAEAAIRYDILADAAAYCASVLPDHTEQLEWLQTERGLTIETIEKHQLGWDDGGLLQHLRGLGHRSADIVTTGLVTEDQRKTLVDSLAARITIPYHVSGNVVSIRGRAWGWKEGSKVPKYKTPPGQSARLFNSDTTWEADQLLVTEGEFDVMVLEQYGFHAVGVPGAAIWPDAWDAYLDVARRAYVIFDNDKAGILGADKLVARFGSKVRRVVMPLHKPGESKNDPTSWLVHKGHTLEEMQGLLKEADGGGLLITVDQAYAEHSAIQGLPGLQYGIEVLDKHIYPGHQDGQVMVVLAKSGCLAGDTKIGVNRCGKGYQSTIRDLVASYEGHRTGSGKTSVRNYKWKEGIPTRVQREVDGVMQLGVLKHAWCSGMKTTYTVTTDTGRTIRATDEHPFLTNRGWLRLDELVVGDKVHVLGERHPRPRKPKPKEKHRCGLVGHPYAKSAYHTPGGYRVVLHRLVVEADMNGLALDHYLRLLRKGKTEGLRFLDPWIWIVHHKDGNHDNNELSNLEVISQAEHARQHGKESAYRNCQYPIVTETIRSVVLFGEEETFDIEVDDDPHNFLANGFVVHNTGKTILLLNFFQRLCFAQPDAKILYVSLEQTGGEWYERARRILTFYQLNTTGKDVLDYWRPRLQIVDRNRLTEESLLSVLDDYEYEMGRKPDLVAIDYLGYWAQSFKGERYERVSDAVMSLKAIAKERRIRIITPHQVSRSVKYGEEPDVDAARDAGVIEETADFMFLLWNPDERHGTNPDQRVSRLQLKIGKSRQGGKGAQLGFQFAPLSLVLVPDTDTQYLVRARDELRYRAINDTWETAVARHRNQMPAGAKATEVAGQRVIRQPKVPGAISNGHQAVLL
jgi:replicative DNA helicase